jgi:hypothetical protein
MSQFKRIGIDTSKAVFFTLHAVDEAGKAVLPVNLRRASSASIPPPRLPWRRAAARITGHES